MALPVAGNQPQDPPEDQNVVIPGQEDISQFIEDEPFSEETPAPPATPPVETTEERLNKALATIETLSTTVNALKDAPYRSTERETPGAPLEVETILGVQLPKDRSKRAVKLTDQDLLALKWNENPTAALETIGNVLVNYVLGVIPTMVETQIASHSQRTDAAKGKWNRYNELFPDLVEFTDLGEIVERRLRADGVHEQVRGEDYLKRVGTETRRRLAGMRGQTLEEYEAAMPARSAQPAPSTRQPSSRTTTGAPRTMTSPQGTRGTRATQTDVQQREMQDLL